VPTASALTRSAAWLIVRLGFLLVPAWIAVVVFSVHALPGISEAGGSQLSGLVPSGAAAVAAQQHEANAFGSTLVTRVVVVQHAEGGLTDRQRERTARLIERRRGLLALAKNDIGPD